MVTGRMVSTPDTIAEMELVRYLSCFLLLSVANLETRVLVNSIISQMVDGVLMFLISHVIL
jgi:hypothetical protein